jgi:hypothetical protein
MWNVAMWNVEIIGTMDSQLENLLKEATSSAITTCCSGTGNQPVLVTFLILHLLKYLSWDAHNLRGSHIPPTINYTHHKPHYVCAMSAAYTVAKRLNYSILYIQYAECRPYPDRRQMCSLLERVYFLNEKQLKYIKIPLEGELTFR